MGWWPFSNSKTETSEPRRTQSRPLVTGKRMYQASIQDRINASWTSAPMHADQIVHQSQRTLVARSRERACNDDYAKRFLGMVVNNVIGSQGIVFQSQAVGNDQMPDGPAQSAIEAAFWEWSKKSMCDTKGRLSFRMMQQMVIRTVATDGEAFIRLHQAGPYGLQLELIDAQLVDVQLNDKTKAGNVIRFGIEFGSAGRPVAYHIRHHGSDSSTYLSSYNGQNYERVPADQILHVFLPEMVDQKRGIPWMSTALQRMKLLTGYEDASLIAAKAGASKMGFFVSETGDQYTGDDVDSSGNLISDFEAGIIEQLPSGVRFESFDPGYPQGEFANFVKSCLRGIASGLGVDYTSLANDLEGVNYSSIRQGELAVREVWKGLQSFMVEDFLDPIFDRWIVTQYQRGSIKIAGRPLSRSIANYTGHYWQPRRWGWVDPLKDIEARAREYELGVTSITRIITESGNDPEEIWQERARERERMRELGIEPGQVLGSLVSGGANDQTDDPST